MQFIEIERARSTVRMPATVGSSRATSTVMLAAVATEKADVEAVAHNSDQALGRKAKLSAPSLR